MICKQCKQVGYCECGFLPCPQCERYPYDAHLCCRKGEEE